MGTDRLLYQARLALDDAARLKVVRKMYEMRFQEKPPEKRSIQQLRGIEGARVRKMYDLFAKQYRIRWNARNYDHTSWEWRCSESVSVSGHGLPLRHLRSGHTGSWVRSSSGLHPYRQATIFCL